MMWSHAAHSGEDTEDKRETLWSEIDDLGGGALRCCARRRREGQVCLFIDTVLRWLALHRAWPRIPVPNTRALASGGLVAWSSIRFSVCMGVVDS